AFSNYIHRIITSSPSPLFRPPMYACCRMLRTGCLLTAALLLAPAVTPQQTASFDVRSFGARGDGQTIDSDAINKAVDAAAAAGGGFVDLPAGRYLSFSIRAKSHVALRVSPGAGIGAAGPASGLGRSAR